MTFGSFFLFLKTWFLDFHRVKILFYANCRAFRWSYTPWFKLSSISDEGARKIRKSKKSVLWTSTIQKDIKIALLVQKVMTIFLEVFVPPGQSETKDFFSLKILSKSKPEDYCYLFIGKYIMVKKFGIRATLGTLVCVWLRITDSIP